jgi:nucleoid-associated protein YgaU
MTPKQRIDTARQRSINNMLAAREVYGRERSRVAAIPTSKRGPGRLTGGTHVTLQAWTVQLSVTALLGADGGKLTGGYGTWAEVTVPRRQGITQWSGQSLFGMDLDLMLDGWGKQVSIERQIATLDKLATRQPGMLTPPSLRIFGAVARPSTRWVITGFDWGDCLRSTHTGERLRQEVVVHLLEYREDTDVLSVPRGPASSKAPRKYRVKSGDNLKKIATRMLGKSSRWHDIAKLNKGLRGPNIPKSWIGKTIKVPNK